MPSLRHLATAAAVAATLGLTTAPAGAGPRPAIDTGGPGTYVLAADGSAAVTGSATGRPFDGTYTATLAAADGSLPDPGECEPATATLRIDGSRNRFVELASVDEVCGQHLQAPYVVTHVFTGRYEVTAASQRRLVGTDGFLEVRLATEGRAGVFAIDT